MMSAWPGIYLTLLLTIFLAPGSVLARGAVTPPTEFPISLFGVKGNEIVPQKQNLTAEEEASFRKYVSSLEPFPRYLYSGCHDRAHAAFKLLPAALKPKIMKIWLLSPGVYSAGFYGLIGLTAADADSKKVQWGYHVALAYRNTRGVLQVFDPALRPGKILSQRDWFDLMSIPPLSLWTLTQGTVYQFNFTQTDSYSVNGSVWTGRYFDEKLGALDPETLPSSIARDVIGVDAVNKVACATLQAQVTNPDQLQNLLKGTLPEDCKASAERYASEKARWTQVLSTQD